MRRSLPRGPPDSRASRSSGVTFFRMALVKLENRDSHRCGSGVNDSGPDSELRLPPFFPTGQAGRTARWYRRADRIACAGPAQYRRGDSMSVNDRLSHVSNGACGIDRRGFLARCAGCSLASGCMVGALGPSRSWQADRHGRPAEGTTDLQSHTPGSTDLALHQLRLRVRKRELTRRLVQGCPEIEFLPATVHTADAARRLIAEDGDTPITGYLVAMVGIWTEHRRGDRRGWETHPVCE